jgi:hypothetical protein
MNVSSVDMLVVTVLKRELEIIDAEIVSLDNADPNNYIILENLRNTQQYMLHRIRSIKHGE